MRIMRTTRAGRQPMARKMPISRVRSNTDITMIVSTKIAAINKATAETAQTKPLTTLSCFMEETNSEGGLARSFPSRLIREASGPSISARTACTPLSLPSFSRTVQPVILPLLPKTFCASSNRRMIILFSRSESLSKIPAT
jgi:hypothetical protein